MTPWITRKLTCATLLLAATVLPAAARPAGKAGATHEAKHKHTAAEAKRAARPDRPLSPPGEAATQVLGHWTEENGRKRYEGGKWIDVTYGRPIKRGRADLFGSGDTYGKDVDAGAPVWRAGANVTTRLHTEAPLEIGGKKIEPGTYSLFIELKPGAWTLIVSAQPFLETYDPANKAATWGSYNYDPKYDVVRAPMTLTRAEDSTDELTWSFLDVDGGSGKLAIAWDHEVAKVAFKALE